MTSIPPLRRLGARLLALAGGCTAAVLLVFGAISSASEAQAIRALSERDMQRLMESVIRSIESIMLPGQASIAQGFAERLKTVPDVVDFRIMRTDGSEAFRDNATLKAVNERLGRAHFELRAREEVLRVLPADDPHLRRATQAGARDLVSFEGTGEGGARELTFLYAIPNQLACQGCHGAARPWLGAVKLTASMAAIDAMAADAHRRTWLAAAGLLVVSLAALGLALHRAVVRPVGAVTEAMQRVAAGHMDEAVPVPREDEIGEMARSFNAMVGKLKATYQGLQLEQDKLNTVIQSTGEGVVVTDAEGSVVLVNEAAVRLLGKRRERIVQDGFLRLLDNEDIVATLLERHEGADPAPYKVSYKGRALRMVAATIRGPDGGPIGSAAIFRDITPSAA